MPLVCAIDDQNQSTNQCIKNVGGVRVTYGVDWNDVEGSTVVAGILTVLTLKSGKKLSRMVFDDDNTASYNQDGGREGLVYRATQAAFLKFTGISNAKVVAANNSKGVLKGLYFHVLNDGSIQTQGAELNADGTKIQASYNGAKINPSVKSNTSEGASAVEYNIASVAADLVPTALTAQDLEDMFTTPAV